MPYITQEQREAFEEVKGLPQSAGELNFVISDLIDDYLGLCGVSYATLNSVIGVLECAKLELYRRVAASYEDRKCEQNGEVFYNALMHLRNMRMESQ